MRKMKMKKEKKSEIKKLREEKLYQLFYGRGNKQVKECWEFLTTWKILCNAGGTGSHAPVMIQAKHGTKRGRKDGECKRVA